MDDSFRQEYLTIAQREAREDLILGNSNLSPVDRLIFVMLERLYPQVRKQRVPIQVWKLWLGAGCTRMSVHQFFVAMHERCYMTYTVRRVLDKDLEDKLVWRTECFVEELEPCQHPENLNLVDTPTRKEHRKKCKERLRCKKCGSENILVKVTAVCIDCGEEIK